MRLTNKSIVVACQIFGRTCGKAVFACFPLFLLATTSLAQYTTARLSGVVADNTAAAIPGATVTA
jgi:hypothetical protein